MGRINALGMTLVIFLAGGLAYIGLQFVGVNNLQAGIWSQVLLFAGLIVWLLTYVFRAVGKNMTYHEQRRQYEEAYLTKRLEDMTPEELSELQAKIDKEEGIK
jgi:membrane protein implicated in regulation of membrane protease activity